MNYKIYEVVLRNTTTVREVKKMFSCVIVIADRGRVDPVTL